MAEIAKLAEAEGFVGMEGRHFRYSEAEKVRVVCAFAALCWFKVQRQDIETFGVKGEMAYGKMNRQ